MAFLLLIYASVFALVYAKPSSVTSEQEKTTIPSESDMYWGLDKYQEEYKLPELPYSFDAFEPYIDANTMEIHISAIFKEYTVKLNALLKEWRTSGEKAELSNTSLVNMWRNLKDIPETWRKHFSYYGGGYINHLIYFSTMKPNEDGINRVPTKEFDELIERSFHNMSELLIDFENSANNIFGSGWVYLSRATGYSDGEYMSVTSTLEEMSPIENVRLSPILALDVWEHAFFKKYGNNRKEYIANWWKTVDWIKVERLLNWWKILEPEVVVAKSEL